MGNEKKAILVSCTDHYRERTYVFDTVLSSEGYETTYLASDFHHIKKEKFKCGLKNALQISVRPYSKNLSVNRILSHRDFAKGVYNYLEGLPNEPDLIVAEIPPNFLAEYLAKYKKRHPKVRLVFDIFDLWPESFPSQRIKSLLKLPFGIWGNLRDKNLPFADSVITECNMYQEKLNIAYNPKVHTLYLAARRFKNEPVCQNIDTSRIVLCYLGSVNNVIDIERIESFVKQLNLLKPCKVKVIGDGEKTDEFLCALNRTGAEVEFHGNVYDSEKKSEIMSDCHFGLNIMKPSVCVALTMKSIDYFSFDLPIINTISADTFKLVDNEKIGFNLTDDTAKTVASLSERELISLRNNVRKVFDREFDLSVVSSKLKNIFKEL